MLIKLELLSRDREAACQAWEAAEALYEQRKETLEAKLKAVELQMMMAEMVLQRDRDLTRTKLLADAEKVWGPGHASRPPLAVHNLCGPLPPAPPPVQHPTGSWVGSRLPPSPPPRRRRTPPLVSVAQAGPVMHECRPMCSLTVWGSCVNVVTNAV